MKPNSTSIIFLMKDDLKEKVLQPKTIKNKNNGCGTAPGNLVLDFSLCCIL